MQWFKYLFKKRLLAGDDLSKKLFGVAFKANLVRQLFFLCYSCFSPENQQIDSMRHFVKVHSLCSGKVAAKCNGSNTFLKKDYWRVMIFLKSCLVWPSKEI